MTTREIQAFILREIANYWQALHFEACVKMETARVNSDEPKANEFYHKAMYYAMKRNECYAKLNEMGEL